MSFAIRMQKKALGAVLAVPPVVRSRLVSFGEPLCRKDLDLDIRTLLSLMSLQPGLDEMPVRKARQAYSTAYKVMDVPRQAVASIKDCQFRHDSGHFGVRIYRPLGVGDLGLPGILFLHGGGFMLGHNTDYDNICRLIANRCGAVVASVDYRLAPEHRFPAAAEDALAAWAWFTDAAVELGMDPQRLGVMGDSAGGLLSIVVAQHAKERKMPLPAAQCLIYPSTDARREYRSLVEYGQHLGLTRDLISHFDNAYLSEPNEKIHPLVSPVLHRKLKGQPKTLMVVCKDPLRDDGVVYADKLLHAGVEVNTLDFPRLIHGFFGMGGMIPAARRAILEICDTFGKML